MKPTIAITMGDPAGIGPEVVLKALRMADMAEPSRLVVLGDEQVLNRAARQLGVSPPWQTVRSTNELEDARGELVLVDFANVPGELPPRPTAEGGRASLDYVNAAIDLAVAGRADAIATAPVHKVALSLAGCTHPGHTEILAERTGTQHYVMMLAGPALRVALVTIHIALQDVPSALTTEQVGRTIQITDRGLRELFGIERPRVAVAGLNPHAGESGRFGTEEAQIIAPAIEQARHDGIDCSGPHPPDTVFHRAIHGQFDAVVVMYHDQGLIPIKLLHFETAVNITLGLPIIRTSADHGTAYDIAGKGIADGGSMARAVELAAQFARRRQAQR